MGPYRTNLKNLMVLHSVGRLFVLPNLNNLRGTNALAYFGATLVTKKKVCVTDTWLSPDAQNTVSENKERESQFKLSNCDICAERKISSMKSTKQYKIWPSPKDWLQKIFRTLPPKFIKGLSKSYHKFCPFCTTRVKMNKMQWIFNQIFKSV